MAVTTDPNALLANSACLSCLPEGRKLDVLAWLLTQLTLASVDPNILATNARCLACIPEGSKLDVLNWLATQLAGTTTDPNVLVQNSRCLACIPVGAKLDVLIWIFTQLAGSSTDPNVLLANSACLACLPEISKYDVLILLLATLAGRTTDPNTLMANAACLACIPDGSKLDVFNWLATQITLTPVTPVVPPNTLPTGIVAYWKLDEANGNAADATGHGFTLTNVNVVTYLPGLIGNAANFVGASSQSLQILSAMGLGIVTSYSLSQWFFRASALNFIDSGFGLVAGNQSGPIWFSDGNLYSYVGGNANFGRVALAGSGSWVHVVNVYDGTVAGNANRLKVYVNGVVQVLTFTGTIPASYSVPAGFALGGNPANGPGTGLIDEVGLWSRALTQAEVTTLYNGGAGKTYPF